MNKYPDFVNKYRPKGTIVKKVRNTYYVYKATSKRVEGKKYPVQVIEGLLGKVDELGFHKTTINQVDTSNVIVREYGFTNFILKFEEEYISRNNNKIKVIDKKIILRSMIVYLCNNSYLADEFKNILSADKLVERYPISINNQIRSIEKTIGYSLKEIEQLKYICMVKMGEREYYSELTKSQKELLDKLGVNEDELR